MESIENNVIPRKLSFDEYERDWIKRHKRSIPKVRLVSSWGLVFGILLWVFIAIVAAVFSGTHAVPTAAMTILKSVPSPTKEHLALSVFAVLEIAVFAGSLYRNESKVAHGIMWLALAGSLGANIGSSIAAVNENGGDGLIMGVGIILAILAPSVALGAGEMSRTLWVKHQAETETVNADNDERRKEIDILINRDYVKYEKDYEKKYFAESSRNFMKSDEPKEVHETSRNPAKPRVKIHEVAKLVYENGDANLSVNELMEKYDISQGSTTKIRELLKGQNSNGYTNGNGTH